jgi:hypothetical protein
MYAHAPTNTTVKHAPAKPEIKYVVAPANDGKTLMSHGMKKVAVSWAIMPATNPKRAINPNIFNLLFIQFTFLFLALPRGAF